MPTKRTDTKQQKKDQTPRRGPFIFPLHSLGHLVRLNLAHTKGGHSPPRMRVDRCCATQRKVRVTRGPCSPDAVQCTFSDCVRPSNGIRGNFTLHATQILTMSSGAFCGPNKGSLSLCQRIHQFGPEYRFKFTPVGTSLLAHQGDKRGATLPHKPITPCQMASLVCGLTAAPCSL